MTDSPRSCPAPGDVVTFHGNARALVIEVRPTDVGQALFWVGTSSVEYVWPFGERERSAIRTIRDNRGRLKWRASRPKMREGRKP